MQCWYRWSCAKPVCIMLLNICFLFCVIETVPLVGFGKLFLKQEHMVGVLLLAGMDLIWRSLVFVKDYDSHIINPLFLQHTIGNTWSPTVIFFHVFQYNFYPYSTGSVQRWLNREIVWYSRGILVLDTIAYQIIFLPNNKALIIHFMRSTEVLWDGCLSL